MTQTYQIVSVEDDAFLYKLLKMELEGLPINLHHAWSGSEALLLLSKLKPDLLLLDITLPDMRGWDVLDKLAQEKKLEGVPVLILTAHKEAPHLLIAALQQVTDYINKPFKPKVLRNRVVEILGISE